MNSLKEQYVYDVFQSVAESYDSANRRISFMQHLRWKKSAVRMLCRKMPVGADVLDIGCGTGDMLCLMSEERKDIHLTGLDFSPNMLKAAKRRLKNADSVSFIRGNAMKLPFDDESFDGIIISFALRNTADYAVVLSEAFRVLRSKGCFVCIDSFVPENRFIRPFYGFYFSCIMPLLGGGISKIKEYRWLNKSTAEFISAAELIRLMQESGFCKTVKRSFLFGACVVVEGRVRKKRNSKTGKDNNV